MSKKFDLDSDMMPQFEEGMNEILYFHKILQAGQKGHHLLFSPEMIRLTYDQNTENLSELFENQLADINRVINESFNYDTLEEKQDFFASQPETLQRALVYGYFQLIEGQIAQEGKTLH
jgi:hypothetical protein